MDRPTSVTIAAAIFFLQGASIGFLAALMLFASIGLVQNPRGTTGIFANSALGVIGLFLGAIILVVAAAVFYIGVGLWRMQKWARASAISLLGTFAALSVAGLLKSLNHPNPRALLLGAVLTGLAAWVVWQLLQPDVIAAFDKAAPPQFPPPRMAAPPWPRS